MPDHTTSPQLTLESMRADVAELLELEPGSVSEQEDLSDLGLDSIRLMALTERWRAAGAEISFLELAEAPVLGQWWERMRG